MRDRVLSITDKLEMELVNSPIYPCLEVDGALYITNEKETALTWISVKLEVISYYDNEVTHEKIIRIKGYPDGFPAQEIDFSASVINKKYLDGLVKYGFTYNEDFTQYVIEYLQDQLDNTDHIINYHRVGWALVDDERIFRTDILVYRDNSDLVKRIYEYNGELKLGTGTNEPDFDEYVTELNSLLTTSGTQFAIVSGLSSVLIGRMNQISNRNSMIVHIYGDSSRGKTTFLKLACSCWGDPNDTPLFSSWIATSNAMMATLKDNYGVAVAFDEASTKRSDFSSLIYGIANGTGKLRCDKNSNLRTTDHWCTTIISSGEVSLLDSSVKNNGLAVRCLEFYNLDITEDSAHSNRITKFIQQNYGMLGILLADALIEWEDDKVQRLIDKSREYMENKLTDKFALSERLLDTYALVIATASLAKKKLGLNISMKKISNILLSHHNSLYAEKNVAFELYNVIMQYISSNRSKFLEKLNGKNFPPFAADGFFEQDYCYITTNTFKQILKSNGYEGEKIWIDRLAEEGFLLKNEKENRVIHRRCFNKIRTNFYKLNIDV